MFLACCLFSILPAVQLHLLVEFRDTSECKYAPTTKAKAMTIKGACARIFSAIDTRIANSDIYSCNNCIMRAKNA